MPYNRAPSLKSRLIPTPSGGTVVKSATLVYSYSDVVLFQFAPNDPYITAADIFQFYITTGSEIISILNFAIGNGVNLQLPPVNGSELLYTLNLFVPWYPVRCVNCWDAINICLRMHPDCFTEIDYSTTPPTFHVRKRANGGVGAGLLTQVTLPYKGTDLTTGRRHVSSNVVPRPELVPTRIGIFYRVVANGQALSFPQDIYPLNAPDGLRAKDYSLDLQGPNSTSSQARLTSVPFDPTNLAWWMTKCPALRATDIPIQGQTGCVNFTSPSVITVKDDNGNVIDWFDNYPYEFLKGTVDFWMSGVNVIVATVTANFTYTRLDANGAPKDNVTSHTQTTRVKLVNYPTTLFTFTQYLNTGELLPTGLAQAVYTALQPLQYNLSHNMTEVPFTGTFVKPGLNGINLSGGSSDWLTMNATVQQSEYTLHADDQGNVFAEVLVRCGPVKHLEPGELIQLFNLFANRDIQKINPWERITGVTNTSGVSPPTDDTMQENSHPSLADKSFDSVFSTIPGS